jgi:FkbM family methyltransferase
MEELNRSKKSRFSQLIEFIRDYRIRIPTTKRLSGIGDTLIGWAFIAINTVFFPPPVELILSEVSFVFFFFSGCLALFFHTIYRHLFQGNLIEGFKDLLIRSDTETHTDAVHLSTSQRIKWIYFRGFIATGGYIAYNISKIYFSVIDNSEIFGADALVYALLAFLILHDVLNIKEISGIIIASLGVFFVIFFDIESFDLKNGLIAGAAGIISAIAMSVIFFITGIIVRHDSPKRVAFHQCMAGLILAIVVLLLTLFFKTLNHNLHFPDISTALVKSSLISGVLYAIALVFFLRAFLRTEPIVIAVIGYSLGIFVILLEWLFNGELIGVKDGISALLIGLGCFLLIHQEYVKDRKKSREIKMQKPIYEAGLKEELASLKDKFQSGDLDRYTYLAEKHEFNKLLLEYVAQIKDSPIESIKILQDALVFAFKAPLNIELETDGGARSAPFEILNFGSYEIEDELMAYALLKDGDTIFDVGAHIGWYAINFAKRFPNSQIYAFEPIEVTFEFLRKNIKRNEIRNVTACNYGCSNKEEEKFLYYFKGGSALASIENLINHKNAQKVKCILKTIDKIVQDLKIQSVDFIKCDAEGSELFVIQGAEETIKKFNPIIFAELYEEWCQKCGYSSRDALKLLKSWGYVPYQAIKGKLKEVNQFELNDSERYNYFFLNSDKHLNLISKYKSI